jgi:hypothetical protein
MVVIPLLLGAMLTALVTLVSRVGDLNREVGVLSTRIAGMNEKMDYLHGPGWKPPKE